MKQIFIFFAFLPIAVLAAGDSNTTSKNYVDTQIRTRQTMVPGIDTNTVITHTETPGNIGQKSIYDASKNYIEQQDALVTADTANTAIQNAIDTEFICTEWLDGAAHTNENCLIYNIKNPFNQSPNKFPAPVNQTQQKNGVTVTVYDGVYSFSGTTNAPTTFEFELPVTYTFPASVFYGGGGVIYFWNNKFVSENSADMFVWWLTPDKTEIDYWSLTYHEYGLNRYNTTYIIQTGKTVKYIQIRIASGINTDGFSFAPMMVEDANANYTRFYPYQMNIYLPFDEQ